MNRRQLSRWTRATLGFVACSLLLAVGAAVDGNADYDRGRAALDKQDWKAAVRAFSDVSSDGDDKADAALYWEAYALNKLNQADRALDVIDRLQRRYPDSRWIDDSELLQRELEGADVEANANEEIKLAALMSLMHSDPDRALPYLEKFLKESHSSESKEQALFLLMQMGNERALEIVTDLARSADALELRIGAIHVLGMTGDPAAQALLGEVYAGTGDRELRVAILESFMMSGNLASILEVAQGETDEELRIASIEILGAMGAVEQLEALSASEGSREFRRALLEAFMISGDEARVLAAARDDSDPELRIEAVQFLGMLGGMDELWEMYGREENQEVKRAILEGLAMGGGTRFLKQVAKGNDSVELRATAIEGLAMTGETSADYLVEIYNSSDDARLAEAALGAMMMCDHVKAMISVARQEKDPVRKREIVEYLAMTGSKEATDYMLELLDD